MALPFQIADALRACLEMELAGPNAPAEVCLRAGAETPLNLGMSQDECCSGLGWVRIASVSPTGSGRVGDSLDDPDLNQCNNRHMSVGFELGVARCAPFGTPQAGPTCDQWTELALLLDEDALAMRRAVCCYADSIAGELDYGPVALVRPGAWEPLDTSGGCAGGIMEAAVLITCGDC
jgi:hypothetical protein